jgi:rhamnosyltransferase subunit B
MARLFDRPVNQARRRLGLRAVSDAFFAPVDSGCPYLVMASPAVIDRPADWPQNVTLTGFVTWDRARAFRNPDGLEEFLSAADPPVLVTLGASSSLDPHDFYRHAAEAVTSLGHRALVLTGPTPSAVELPVDPRIFNTTFAALSQVAARCHAAIHHGGVGTTVGLLMSGLPQVVVPRGFDQPADRSARNSARCRPDPPLAPREHPAPHPRTSWATTVTVATPSPSKPA